MAVNVGELNIVLGIDISEFEAALAVIDRNSKEAVKNLTRNLEMILIKFTKVGASLSAAITGPIMGMEGSIVQDIAALSQAVIDIGTIVGENAKRMENWTDSFKQLKFIGGDVSKIGIIFRKELMPAIDKSVIIIDKLFDSVDGLSPVLEDINVSLNEMKATMKLTASTMMDLAKAGTTTKDAITFSDISNMTQGLIKYASTAAGVAGILSSAGGSAAAFATGLASVTAVALPLIPAIAAIGAIVAFQINKQNKLRDKLKESVVSSKISAEEFWDTLEDKKSVETFNDNINTALEVVNNFNETLDTVDQIDNEIELRIDTSLIEEATTLLESLNTAYGNLLLSVGNEGVSSSEVNESTVAYGESLKALYRDIVQPQIDSILEQNIESSLTAEYVNEITSDINEFDEKVDTAVAGITEYNDAIAQGGNVSAETVDNYRAGIAILDELNAEVGGITESTKTLDEQLEDLNVQSLLNSSEDNAGFALQVQTTTGVLMDEMLPVIQTVDSAMAEFNSTMETSKESIANGIIALNTEFQESVNLANIYTELSAECYGNEQVFSDYVALQKDENTKLDSLRKTAVENFANTLTEEEKLALQQLDSSEEVYSQLTSLADDYYDDAQEVQQKINDYDVGALLDEAEVSALETALGKINTAFGTFNENGEITFSEASQYLKSYLESCGVELDEGTLTMLDSLISMETDLSSLTTKSGAEALENLLSPFMDDGEISGEEAFSNFASGIENGLNNRLETLNLGYKEMAEGEVGAYNQGLGNESPSWKAEESSANFIQGAVNGLENNAYILYEKAREIADTVSHIINKTWEIKSPSGVARRIGVNFTTGLEIGLNEKTEQLRQTARNIADTVTKSTQKAFNVMVGQGSLLLSGANSNDNKSITNNYNNQRSISTSINVQSADKLEWDRAMSKLLRKQAALIAR